MYCILKKHALSFWCNGGVGRLWTLFGWRGGVDRFGFSFGSEGRGEKLIISWQIYLCSFIQIILHYLYHYYFSEPNTASSMLFEAFLLNCSVYMKRVTGSTKKWLITTWKDVRTSLVTSLQRVTSAGQFEDNDWTKVLA